MQIGFVNFNTEEKKRVAKMMQLLQESELSRNWALEECGITSPIHYSLEPLPFSIMPSILL